MTELSPVSRLPEPSVVVPTKRMASSSSSINFDNASSYLGSQSQIDSGSKTNLAGSAVENPLQGLELGFRVEVSGNRRGIVRFMGSTEFAKGFWVGVELEEAKGRNDGAVNGVRYFQTQPNFGLFAPAEKVKVLGASQQPVSVRRPSTSNSNVPQLSSTQRRTSAQTPRLPSTSLRSRTDSQESINSISSNMSSASRTRPRLGVTALDRNRTPTTPLTTKRGSTSITTSSNITSPTDSVTVLQKVLKEKEEHVEQLLKERDSERTEVSRAALRAEKAEMELDEIKRALEMLEEELKLSKEREEILMKEKDEEELKLLEEKQKVEDLLFQMAEKNIDSTSLKSRAEEDESRLFDLQEQFNEERSARESLEIQLQQEKSRHQEEVKKLEEMSENFQKHTLDLEFQVLQMTNQETSLKVLLGNKNAEVNSVKEEISHLQKSSLDNEIVLKEMKQQLEAARLRETELLQSQANHEASQIQALSREKALREQLESLASSERDLQYELGLSQSRAEQFHEANARLEREYQELMASMGGSSEELTALQGQLKERNETLSKIQDDLAVMHQKYEQVLADLDKESKKLSEAHDTCSNLECSLGELRKELSIAHEALTSQSATHEAVLSELKISHSSSEAGLQATISSLKAEHLGLQQSSADEHKHEIECLKGQISTAQQHSSQLESKLAQTNQEKDELIAQNVSLSHEVSTIRERMNQMQEEVNQMTQAKNAAQSERQLAQKNLLEIHAKLDEAQIRLDVALKEKQELVDCVSNLKEEILYYQANEVNHTASHTDKVTAMEEALRQTQQEALHLQENVQKLEIQNSALVSELEKVQASLGALQGSYSKEKQEWTAHVDEIKQTKEKLEKEMSILRKESETLRLACHASEENVRELKRELELSTLRHNQAITDLLQSKMDLEQQLKETERSQTFNIIPKENGDNDNIQSSFLNSIIAEQYSKIQELERKIELLTSVELNQFERSEALRKYTERVYCEECEIFDAHETSVCPKLIRNNGCPSSSKTTKFRKASQQLSLRMYCDNCQVFDLHNTEDCDNSSPLPTAYCPICNTFGHAMSDCPDDNTF